MKRSRYSPRRKKSSSLRWLPAVFGGLFLLFALLIAVVDYASFQKPQSVYPNGISVEGIPLGGLDHARAEARLAEAFSVPVELRYQQARLQFAPIELGFSPDYTATLTELEQNLPKRSWFKHLWGKTEATNPLDLPLIAEVDLDQTQAFLTQVIPPATINQPPPPCQSSTAPTTSLDSLAIRCNRLPLQLTTSRLPCSHLIREWYRWTYRKPLPCRLIGQTLRSS